MTTYKLKEDQLNKLCFDIFTGLHADQKTLSSINNIKELSLKVVYMNEDCSRVNSVIPPTSKQINEALVVLLRDSCVIKVQKSGVAHYMRNADGTEFENPYKEGADELSSEDDNDDVDMEDSERADEEVELGDETLLGEEAKSLDEVENEAAATKRQRKSNLGSNAKKLKKKETNPLRRKINPELLAALAIKGVFIMEGEVVKTNEALAAAENIEKGLWHTSMRPRAQKGQPTLHTLFGKKSTCEDGGDIITVTSEDEGFYCFLLFLMHVY